MGVTIVCRNVEFANITAIIFDKDGTLEDSLPFWREIAVRRARAIDAKIPGVGEPLLMAFGIQDNLIDPAGLMAVGSRQENEIAAAAYIAETGKSWHEAIQIAREAFIEVSESKYLQKTPKSAPLFPEVRETLEFLHSCGLKLGILSADSTAEVHKFVANHQLEKYFQVSMGVDGKLFKPNPQLYIQACQALKVPPEQTLMVGDSWGDMEMARKAKAQSIGIKRGSLRVSSFSGNVDISCLSEIKFCSG